MTADARHAWKFPPDLSSRHIEELKKRAISRDFALASGIRTIADNEARELGFAASIPAEELKNGLQGILFPYRDIHNGAELTWRTKPDRAFSLNGRSAKYLGIKGDHIRAFYPHTTTEANVTNVKVQVFITEGEFKSLALAENILPVASRPTCVIGLQGVNGGWRRDKIDVILPTGERETRKEGHPHLIDDLDEWEWRKRVVYLIFDSDIATKANASEFKKSKKSGAWGAEYTLAQLLKARDADVRIVCLPPRNDGAKYGVDDLIAERNAYQVLKIIYNSHVAERDVDSVLYAPEKRTLQVMNALELIRTAPAKPKQVIDRLLPIGCVALLAGEAGAGKSLIALNASQAVASGTRFLDCFDTEQGRAVYVQCEMPQWMMADRLKKMPGISENLVVISPGAALPLNYWEPDGFNKRRDTGYRETTMKLLEEIKAQAPLLVVLDPLKDFTSLSMMDQDAIRHMFNIFRMISTHAQCGVLVVHHHRKTGGRDRRYEGQDDMAGSYLLAAEADTVISLYKETRGDETSRYKLMFSKTRHSAPIDPLEIDRMSGVNSLDWKGIPWMSDRSNSVETKREVIIDVLREGEAEWGELLEKTGLPRETLRRNCNKLIETRRIFKKGNVYRIALNFNPQGE